MVKLEFAISRMKDKDLGKVDPEIQKIWTSIAKNYPIIEGAQLSNSFIILMVLNGFKEPENTTAISRLISLYSGGQI